MQSRTSALHYITFPHVASYSHRSHHTMDLFSSISSSSSPPSFSLPSSSSSKYSSLFAPHKDLSSNFAISLSTELDFYLTEISEILPESHAEFPHSLINFNFSEAALLVQGSAGIYSKKVEFLYELIHKTLSQLEGKSTLCAVATGNNPNGKKRGNGNGESFDSDTVLSLLLHDSDPVLLPLDLDDDSLLCYPSLLSTVPPIWKSLLKGGKSINILENTGKILSDSGDFYREERDKTMRNENQNALEWESNDPNANGNSNGKDKEGGGYLISSYFIDNNGALAMRKGEEFRSGEDTEMGMGMGMGREPNPSFPFPLPLTSPIVSRMTMTGKKGEGKGETEDEDRIAANSHSHGLHIHGHDDDHHDYIQPIAIELDFDDVGHHDESSSDPHIIHSPSPSPFPHDDLSAEFLISPWSLLSHDDTNDMKESGKWKKYMKKYKKMGSQQNETQEERKENKSNWNPNFYSSSLSHSLALVCEYSFLALISPSPSPSSSSCDSDVKSPYFPEFSSLYSQFLQGRKKKYLDRKRAMDKERKMNDRQRQREEEAEANDPIHNVSFDDFGLDGNMLDEGPTKSNSHLSIPSSHHHDEENEWEKPSAPPTNSHPIREVNDLNLPPDDSPLLWSTTYEDSCRHHLSTFFYSAQKYLQSNDFTKKVEEWEKTMEERLREEEKEWRELRRKEGEMEGEREGEGEVQGQSNTVVFDIIKYKIKLGRKICQQTEQSQQMEEKMNKFDVDNNDRDTNSPSLPISVALYSTSRREICRYFCATLQLATEGKIDIQTVRKEEENFNVNILSAPNIHIASDDDAQRVRITWNGDKQGEEFIETASPSPLPSKVFSSVLSYEDPMAEERRRALISMAKTQREEREKQKSKKKRRERETGGQSRKVLGEKKNWREDEDGDGDHHEEVDDDVDVSLSQSQSQSPHRHLSLGLKSHPTTSKFGTLLTIPQRAKRSKK